MPTLTKALKSSLEGEVRDDPITKRVYSVDASIYEIEPLCVVTPKTVQDVVLAVKIATECGASIIPRGAATGITGGCLGQGVILDLSKYLTRISGIDWERETVTCQPGVVQDQLNRVLAERGYRLGPDTSTGNRATIGGMLANNAAGARSLKYGTMVDAVLETEIVLDDSCTLRFEEMPIEKVKAKAEGKGREAEIYSITSHIREEYKQDIEKHFPPLLRKASGYNLDQLIAHESLNLSKLIAGSEGTLGVALEITLQIVPVLKKTGICLVQFENMLDGMQEVETILKHNPTAVEMLDHHILQMAKSNLTFNERTEALFAIELEAESENSLNERLNALKNALQQRKIGQKHTLLTNPKSQQDFWNVRKAGLGLLMAKRSYTRAIAFIEDLSVRPEKLGDFLRQFKSYMKELNKEFGIYGHVGSGCMHIRPYMDLRSDDDVALMEKILLDVKEMILQHQGLLSGEHGDGLIRSWLNEDLFGTRVYQAFKELKTVFDPENRMNPSKIVAERAFPKNFRQSLNFSEPKMDTFLDFSKEGGFELAVDMCNGNALCRKMEKTMCPSFQVTKDEYDSTRARAQALRALTTGGLQTKNFANQQLYDVLDLCIQCKGCKRECPSQVDMAKMKAEFLYHYHRKKGYRLRDRLFAFIGFINSFAARTPNLSNALLKNSFLKSILETIGIAKERNLPLIAKKRFTAGNKTRYFSDKCVALFIDTFTEFNCPEIGLAAKKTLEALGFSVIIPKYSCCSRTLISKGFLPQAKKAGKKLIQTLFPLAKKRIPIVGIEPSCLLTIKEDYPSLLGAGEEAEALCQVLAHCYTFDAFISRHMGDFAFKNVPEEIYLHGHCHEKAHDQTLYTKEILNFLGARIKELPTGCCGMAGSFGYEREHYAFSLKIAKLQLLPSLANVSKDSVIVANGFSCRHQIEHLTNFKPLHLAELLYPSVGGIGTTELKTGS